VSKLYFAYFRARGSKKMGEPEGVELMVEDKAPEEVELDVENLPERYQAKVRTIRKTTITAKAMSSHSLILLGNV
jgi:hypothetical protein